MNSCLAWPSYDVAMGDMCDLFLKKKLPEKKIVTEKNL